MTHRTYRVAVEQVREVIYMVEADSLDDAEAEYGGGSIIREDEGESRVLSVFVLADSQEEVDA